MEGAIKKILIIDDEINFCALLKINLELIGDYSVIITASGKEGIQFAEQNRPDLILLDLIMPKMDGVEVLKTLKGNDKTSSIPIIMLTGMGDEESQNKVIGLYDVDYIVKPVDIEVLKSKIVKLLAEFKKNEF